MARTHGGSASTGRKTMHPHSHQSRVSSKRSKNWLSTVATAPLSGISSGMNLPPSPTYSMPSSLYGFLRSLNVRSVGLNPTTVSIVNPINGWALVVYEPPIIELVTREILTESFESSSNLEVGMGTEEPVSASVFTEDSDDDEPIIWFRKIVKINPQSTLKLGLKPQRKTTTTPNIPLNTPLYRRQTRSSGPAPVLPLPKDIVEY